MVSNCHIDYGTVHAATDNEEYPPHTPPHDGNILLVDSSVCRQTIERSTLANGIWGSSSLNQSCRERILLTKSGQSQTQAYTASMSGTRLKPPRPRQLQTAAAKKNGGTAPPDV